MSSPSFVGTDPVSENRRLTSSCPSVLGCTGCSSLSARTGSASMRPKQAIPALLRQSGGLGCRPRCGQTSATMTLVARLSRIVTHPRSLIATHYRLPDARRVKKKKRNWFRYSILHGTTTCNVCVQRESMFMLDSIIDWSMRLRMSCQTRRTLSVSIAIIAWIVMRRLLFCAMSTN